MSEVRDCKKIALLGGSFNPPHIGHLVLADEVIHRLGYDKVVFVPARCHPFKGQPLGAGDSDRVAMLKAAIADNSAFEITLCEMERPGVSYTYDTVESLEQKYADTLSGKIALVIGDDLIADFDKWYRARELSERADIVLARRLPVRIEENKNAAFSYPHIELENAVLPVSSSDIRERIAAGKSWRYLVTPRVSEYIIARSLYGKLD
jgi:nicotinate-nucleotide adenylyltransferase